MDNTKQQELELQAITDFRVFAMLVWEHLRMPRPTEMQFYIADFLQEKHPRKFLAALRGIGKTYLGGTYACWKLLRNPNEKILVVSQSGTHSDAIAQFIRKLIDTMPMLIHLKPDMGKGHRTSITSFDVGGSDITVQPSVKSLGITSQLQGNRASLLISDDIEGKQNSATEVRREQLSLQAAEFEAILMTTDDAEILVLGTYQGAESIYHGFTKDGYVTRVFPARYPQDTSIYNGCLAPYIEERCNTQPELIGQPIDTRFTDEDLIRRENRYGKSEFNLQFQLDTSLNDANKYPLKQSDLIVTDLDTFEGPSAITWSSESSKEIQQIPNVGFRGDKLHRPGTISTDLKQYEGVILAIDPSGTGSDETGWCVIAHLLGRLYVLDFGGFNGGYTEENLMFLANKAKEFKVHDIYIEQNFGDGMYRALLAPIVNSVYPCNIEEVRVNTQKEVRIIDTLEPIMNQHRLIFNYSSVHNDVNSAIGDPKKLMYSLMFQLSHITRDRQSLRHDDRLDVLALGVSYWLERDVLEQNLDNALAAYRSKQLDKQLKDFIRSYKTNPLNKSRFGSGNKPKALEGLRGYS
jgi:hypothetical protein